MTGRNQYVSPNSTKALEQMKWEIANEFGVQLGADTPSRMNGSVGGEMTKRMVAVAQQSLAGKSTFTVPFMDGPNHQTQTWMQ